jgi:hypothetical protein
MHDNDSRLVVERLARDEWEALVAAAPGVTPFVHPEWLAYQQQLIRGSRDSSLLFRFADGVRAGLPLIEVPGTFNRPGWWSVAHDEYGGLLADRPLSPSHYREAYQYLARRYRPIRMTMPPQIHADAAALASQGWESVQNSTHILDVPASYEIWFNTVASRSCRRYVRRAEKSDLTASDAKSPDNIRAYFDLYGLSTERWGSKSRHEQSFFEQLLRCPLTRLLVVYRQGEPAAAMITLEFRDYIAYYLGVSNRELSTFMPTYFGLTLILRGAITRQVRVLNFGSSLGIESLEQFKEQFGAKRQAYTSYYIEDAWTRLHRFSRYYRSRLAAAFSRR